MQGEGLQAPLTCSFSNSSSRVNVTATAVNATSAVCTTPSWALSNLTSLDAARSGLDGSSQAMLTVSSGGCALQQPFEFYADPEIMGVSPLQGPRYGSFQLTVDLGSSMDFATVDWVRTWLT